MQARETLREAFDRDGFVHVEAFMSQQEMDEIEAHLARFIRDIVPSLPKPEAMHEDYDDPASLKQIPQLNAHDAFFAELLAHPKVVSLARDLLQDDVVPQNVEYFSKPPGRGKSTPPHQDGYYFCLVPNEALTIWIAIDDVDEENGALYYVAGLRQKGVLPHGASHVLGFSQGLTAGATSEFGREVLCRVKRGDCLVHHSLTIHAAGGNPSARKRRAIGLIYYARRAKVDPELQRRYQESLASQRKDLGIA